MNTNKFALNSYNEWGRLREVIVGNPFSKDDILVDFSFCHFHFDNINTHFDIIKKHNVIENENVSAIKFNPQYIDELREDIDGLVLALEKVGVNVLRPKQIKSGASICLPYWEAKAWPALNVRDRILILGDNMIETTPCIRSRYLETDLLKEILYGYFQTGANWICMPRPVMTDASFDLSYINNQAYKSASRELISFKEKNYYDIGIELLMDAANCLRLGKDIIINVADKNQYLAFQWLKRTLGHGFNFHKIDSLTDNHIDSYIIIIRPGLLLLRNKSVIDKLPEFMSNWDYIIAPEPTDDLFPNYESDNLIITSKYIDTNILSLNENTVIANSLNKNLIQSLEKRNINVIPVRHRHRRLFGGGFHCFTLDTNRDSEYISYI
ncbi:MAG: hypothetical protein LBT50_03920 [Prevotellaceae bacterium]|jgi:glycine amidinotransferase|nr:hypothetical protein [Prevotellaceae bacterium]